MTEETAFDLALKSLVIDKCRFLLQDRVALMKSNMDDAQAEANSHKGAMESRYDTFKEDAQSRVSGYAMELEKSQSLLRSLDTIPAKKSLAVAAGSLVGVSGMTNNVVYAFMFANISADPIVVDGRSILTMSIKSPIGQALEGGTPGSKVNFRGKSITILDVV